MSFAEIEAELEKLEPDQLRRLALKSWAAYVEKESGALSTNVCDEDDPQLLAALDDAVRRADASPNDFHSGQEVRSRLSEWSSR